MPLPPSILSTIGLAGLLLVTLALPGCGRREVLGSVSGVVTIEGQPVPRATVIFDNDQLGVHMMAEADEQGRYTVRMANGDGLPLGEYDVRVCPPVQDHPLGPIKAPPSGQQVDPYRDTIPLRYRDRKTSNLKLVVTPETNHLNVNMKRD
jgi:hypothetical protein